MVVHGIDDNCDIGHDNCFSRGEYSVASKDTDGPLINETQTTVDTTNSFFSLLVRKKMGMILLQYRNQLESIVTMRHL